MPLVLNEEQNMLREAAKSFCTDNAPISQLRSLRDNKSELGFDPAIWQQMVELGWAGIAIPEEFGGSGFGYLGMGVVMEECGRTLAASPLFSAAVLVPARYCMLVAKSKRACCSPKSLVVTCCWL